jgi:plasmid stabilization system protein ParE
VLQSVSFRPKARKDIDREWKYLLSQSSIEIADRFLDAVEHTCQMLSTMPLSGSACEFSAPRATSIRRFPLQLPFGRWLIFYEPAHPGILVQRILHSSQDLRGLFV